MQIQVVSCSKPEWKEKPPKAKWQEVILTYVSGGKTQAKKFLSFDPIFNKIKEMEPQEQYDVTLVKDGDYWKWSVVEKLGADAPAVGEAPPKAMSRPSTYETPEERAKKQVYIIRQSCLGYALTYSDNVKALKTEAEVAQIADFFVAYVLRTDPFAGMKDDIPWEEPQ